MRGQLHCRKELSALPSSPAPLWGPGWYFSIQVVPSFGLSHSTYLRLSAATVPYAHSPLNVLATLPKPLLVI